MGRFTNIIFLHKKMAIRAIPKGNLYHKLPNLEKTNNIFRSLNSNYVHSFNLVDVVAKEVKMKANFLIFYFLFSLNIMIIIFTKNDKIFVPFSFIKLAMAWLGLLSSPSPS